CGGVVTQAYGQPDNPVSSMRGKEIKTPSHIYRRAISRIATTGSTRSKKSNDKPSKEKTPSPCAFC
ncbi:TPA: hypothetical protein ACV7YG_005857, partial [Escherichia coli]